MHHQPIDFQPPAEIENTLKIDCICVPVDIPGQGAVHSHECVLARMANAVVRTRERLKAQLDAEPFFVRTLFELLTASERLAKDSLYEVEDRSQAAGARMLTGCMHCASETMPGFLFVHEEDCAVGRVIASMDALVKFVESESNLKTKEAAKDGEGGGTEVGKLPRNPLHRGVNALFEKPQSFEFCPCEACSDYRSELANVGGAQ